MTCGNLIGLINTKVNKQGYCLNLPLYYLAYLRIKVSCCLIALSYSLSLEYTTP